MTNVGGTYKLFESVALISLLLEREARKTAAARRLLSIEPDLRSPSVTARAGKGFKMRKQPRDAGRWPHGGRPGREWNIRGTLWS